MADNLLPITITLFLLILSVSISLASTLVTAATDSDLVLDVEGNPLEVGSEYYIQPAIGFRGGIGRSGRSPSAPDLSCPLYAIEVPSEVNRGDPVKFVPVDETQKQIHLSSDVQIDSGFSAYCRDDGLWRLALDAYNRRLVVIASGAFNAPRSLFKIETTDGSLGAYRITTAEQEGSSYLTLFRDRLSRLTMLGLTDDPSEALLIIFAKYNKDVVATM